jgi:hypothetical protein
MLLNPAAAEVRSRPLINCLSRRSALSRARNDPSTASWAPSAVPATRRQARASAMSRRTRSSASPESASATPGSHGDDAGLALDELRCDVGVRHGRYARAAARPRGNRSRRLLGGSSRYGSPSSSSRLRTSPVTRLDSITRLTGELLVRQAAQQTKSATS